MTSKEFTLALDGLSQPLRAFAYKLTQNHEEANDLLQETVLKAFSNREKFKYGTNLKAWLYTIMKNTFITNYQRMMRRSTFIDTTENYHFLNSTATIDNQAFANFNIGDIKSAIKRLDDSYKTPFVMYFRGYKYLEIADKLDLPLGTVKNRIHLARKELQKSLKSFAA